jgi:8-oxo-dGTP pyrophosphatase MutT (NUDIX family)
VKGNDNRAAIVAHYAVSVKPSPVTPSPAATLVLLRDRAAGGFDTLLMQRHLKSKFAAGDFVFPGGKLHADDNPDDAAEWCAGLQVTHAARVLGLEHAPRTALAYWIGAIRETFEEVGVLLARNADGDPVRVSDPRFSDYRRACQTDNHAFWSMVTKERFTLATDGLVYFAHWVTPEDLPLRFDTRFFAAELPEGQEASGDDHEVIALRWMSPREALDAQRAGELSLRYPTIRNLMLFDGAATAAHALARLRGRDVPVVRPRVLMEDGKRSVVIPGDPGYDAAS